jgi:hypothetical protein
MVGTIGITSADARPPRDKHNKNNNVETSKIIYFQLSEELASLYTNRESCYVGQSKSVVVAGDKGAGCCPATQLA